jgi:hypothetical protein
LDRYWKVSNHDNCFAYTVTCVHMYIVFQKWNWTKLTFISNKTQNMNHINLYTLDILWVKWRGWQLWCIDDLPNLCVNGFTMVGLSLLEVRAITSTMASAKLNLIVNMNRPSWSSHLDKITRTSKETCHLWIVHWMQDVVEAFHLLQMSRKCHLDISL